MFDLRYVFIVCYTGYLLGYYRIYTTCARKRCTQLKTYFQNALDWNCSLFAAGNTHWDTVCNRQSQTTAISWLVIGVNELKVETSKHESHEGHGFNGGELLSKTKTKKN